MTDVTGLIPVMSSADSHDSTSRLLPAEVEVVVARLIRRSFGQQPYKSPSVYEKVGCHITAAKVKLCLVEAMDMEQSWHDGAAVAAATIFGFPAIHTEPRSSGKLAIN
uniref:Retrotransposon protein, putative, unclassified n=1 Tax=Oryza sativa subsp. japonica TaxID=39947 RepID=Q10PN4_ORYSJ|nr:retrotransposon protein, putative, unclassified [Oryza sativa Japonica Group]